jgi:hypothetical protein
MRVIAKQIGNVTRYTTARGDFDIIPIKKYWPYGKGNGKPRTTFFEVRYPLSNTPWRTVFRDRREAILFIERNG